MQDSPLELEFYYVEALHWALLPGGDKRDEAPLRAADIECRLERADLEPPRYVAFRLSLTLPPQSERFAYEWHISLVGHFRLHELVPDEQVDIVLDSNAPAVLYSAAREALATAMGRGPFRPPLLPSVNFLNMERPALEVVESAAPLAPTKPRRISKRVTKSVKGPRKTGA